jgi:methylmalonyl-CoA mutase
MVTSTFFAEFQKPSAQEWKDVFVKELKGKSFDDLLVKHLEIENLVFDAALSSENIKTSVHFITSGTTNTWINEAFIQVTDAKTTNAKALKLLMAGATGLRFVFSELVPDLTLLFENIGFEYIHTSIECATPDQYDQVETFLTSKQVHFVVLNDTHLSQIDSSSQTIRIDILQQSGANATQELSYALTAGHAALTTYLANGKSVIDANAALYFNFGIGNNYLVEIAKFRAFQALWQSILANYDPSFSEKANVSAQTTFVNKSLQDPHTNMLRQTTEAMSAVLGGVDRICVVPYDLFSTIGTTTFSERMALNISNVIAEESYLDIVNDPAKGSYSIEYIMQLLIDASWSYFQQWNTSKLSETITNLQNDVEKTANQRITRFLDKKDQFIGINVYPNLKPVENQWVTTENTFFPPLILENHLSTSQS